MPIDRTAMRRVTASDIAANSGPWFDGGTGTTPRTTDLKAMVPYRETRQVAGARLSASELRRSRPHRLLEGVPGLSLADRAIGARPLGLQLTPQLCDRPSAQSPSIATRRR